MAQVGTTKYETLQEAFEGAATESTIKILKDIEDFGAITFTGKTLTLDMAGHTISGRTINVGEKATLYIGNGTTDAFVVVDKNNAYKVSYDSSKYGKVSLTNGVYAINGGKVYMRCGMVESLSNIAFYAEGDKTGKTSIPSQIYVRGGYVKAQEFCVSPQGKGACVSISGGVLESLDNAVVGGNGTKNGTKNCGGTTTTISGGTFIGRIQSEGYVACGVYHPQDGTLSITGGTIYADGGVGVLVRSGKMTMTGGEVIATGATSTSGWVGDKKTNLGASGVIIDRDADYPDAKTMTVTIDKKAVVSGAKAAVEFLNAKNLEGGENAVLLLGGTYNTDVTDLLGENSVATKGTDGNYTVTTYYAQVDGKKYQTLQEAFDKAGAKKTVTILKDIDNFGVVTLTGKTLYLDMAGHTISGRTINVGEKATLYIGNGTTDAFVVVDKNNAYKVSYDSSKYGKVSLTDGVCAINGGKVYMRCGMVESLSNIAFYAEGDKTGKTSISSQIYIRGGYVKAQEFCVSPQGKGARVSISGGVLESLDNAVVGGNGTKNYGGTTTTISGGTFIGRIQSEGYVACGVYHPQDGTLSITGGTIYADGGVGVLVRSGKMTMTGGEVIATGTTSTSGWVGDKKTNLGASGVIIDRDADYPDAKTMTVTIDKKAVVSGAKAAVEFLNAKNLEGGENAVLLLGGTYNTDVTDLLGENSVATKGTDGNYTVTTYYAQVGETKYATLAEAVAAATSAETPVVLLNDVDLTAIGKLVIGSSKDITLDLNGNSIKCSNNDNYCIVVNGKLTLKDDKENSTGRIYTVQSGKTSTYRGTLIKVNGGGTFIMESGCIDAALDDAASNGQFGVGVWGTGKVTINGGIINAGWYAIAGNGAENDSTSITINGGELISTADYAIYHPQPGTLTINGGTVYGEAGAVAMKRGDLVINDGTLTSKGKGDTGTWGTGTGNLGNAALNFSKLYGNVTATIKGGKITAEGNALVVDAQHTAGKEADIAISGGTYSSDVSAYCADGFMAQKNEDGTYGITEAKDAFLVYQDKNEYIATGNDVAIDWLSLKKMVVANDVDNVSVSLNRDYKNTGWNSIYVPFDIKLTEDMLNTFEFAKIWDTELNPDNMSTTIEFYSLKAGDVIKANTPSLIRAKEAGEKTLRVENATIKKATTNTIDCATIEQNFVFCGVLEQTYIAEKYGFYLRSADNALVYNENKEASISPFMFYMTIQNRDDGSYYVTPSAKKIAIRVIGSEEATGVANVNAVATEDEGAVYNLQGVRVSDSLQNLPKGVYIRNGHKFVVK